MHYLRGVYLPFDAPLQLPKMFVSCIDTHFIPQLDAIFRSLLEMLPVGKQTNLN
jgi:hypothetical protein